MTEPTAKPSGAILEALVRSSARLFAKQGLSLRQQGPRFSGKVGQRGKAVGRIIGPGGLDFEGDYHGRRVIFDAKSCAGTSFPLSLLKDHQVKQVRLATARGVLAFFLVEMTQPTATYWALTWRELEPWWRGATLPGLDGRQSIPRDAIERCIPVRRNGQVLDLASAIENVRLVLDLG